MWQSRARLDNTRELVLECSSNLYLDKLFSMQKKSPYLISGGRGSGLKDQSLNTRADSAELQNSSRGSGRRRSSSGGQELFEVYDSELDVTIISNDS